MYSTGTRECSFRKVQKQVNTANCEQSALIEFFTVYTKLAEMAILYSKDKKLPPVGLELIPEIITGLGVQCLTK